MGRRRTSKEQSHSTVSGRLTLCFPERRGWAPASEAGGNPGSCSSMEGEGQGARAEQRVLQKSRPLWFLFSCPPLRHWEQSCRIYSEISAPSSCCEHVSITSHAPPCPGPRPLLPSRDGQGCSSRALLATKQGAETSCPSSYNTPLRAFRHRSRIRPPIHLSPPPRRTRIPSPGPLLAPRPHRGNN